MTEINKFIEEMRATSSATDKIAIIKNSSTFIHNVLEATYNPYKQYYVTSKTCKKNHDKVAITHYTLFETLHLLSSRKVTGHDAIKLVNKFSNNALVS